MQIILFQFQVFCLAQVVLNWIPNAHSAIIMPEDSKIIFRAGMGYGLQLGILFFFYQCFKKITDTTSLKKELMYPLLI